MAWKALLELVLTLNGLNFIQSAKSVSTRVLAILSHLTVISVFYYRSCFFLFKFKITKENFYAIEQFQFYASNILIHHWFFCHRNQIKHFVNQLNQINFVNEKRSRKFVLCYLMYTFECAVESIIKHYRNDDQQKHAGTTIEHTHIGTAKSVLGLLYGLASVYAICWAFVVQLVYILVLGNVHLTSQNILQKILDCDLENAYDLVIARFYWRKAKLIRQRFDEIFSILPFIWTFGHFTYFSDFIVSIRFGAYGLETHTIFNYVTGLGVFCATLPLIALIFLNEQHNQKEKEMFKQIAIRLITKSSPKGELLLQEVRADLELELTGWNMFTLRREIYLTFASSLITYTVFISGIL